MEVIDKLTTDIFKSQEDKVFELFSKIVNTDKDQIIRYCRDDIIPLWFCQNNIISVKNLKCKNCGEKLIYEFQVNFFKNHRLCQIYTICTRK